MTSQAVTKAVAKKLKYYVDIKRREDGFDLSGPYHPPQDPVHLRAGPTLAYDGLHDRSLKHYFRDTDVKKQVGKMTVPERTTSRQTAEIRSVLDREMSKRSYMKNLGSTTPYVSPDERSTPRHRPRALISVDQYLKTKRGSKARKVKADVVGKPRTVLRRSPPRNVSRNEQERLVNLAARLIAATETAALPGNRSQTRSESFTDSLPEVNSKGSYTEDTSDSEVSMPSVCPRPPSRIGGPRPKWTPPARAAVSLPQSASSNKHKPRSPFAKSPLSYSDERSPVRPKNVKSSPKKKVPNARRPQTASYADKKQEPSLHPQTRPRSAKYAYRKDGDLVVNGRDEEEGGREMKKDRTYSTDSWDEEDTVGSRQEEDDSRLFYKRSSQNRTMSRSRILTYQVYVVTGDFREAGTSADMKLTLFGEHGTSGERPLLKSMNHARKFCDGQVDIFALDSVYLGDIHNIRIGHSQTSPEYGWYLETVFVSEGPKEDTVFEFPCRRWFSSKKDDGQILRDICVSRLLTESDMNEKLKDYERSERRLSDRDSYSSSSSNEHKAKDHEALSSDDDRSPTSRGRHRRKGSRKRGDKRVSFEQDEKERTRNHDKNEESRHASSSESQESEKDEGKNTRESNSGRSNSGRGKSARSNSGRAISERTNSERTNSGGSTSERSYSEESNSESKHQKRTKKAKSRNSESKKSGSKDARTRKSEDEYSKEGKPEGEKSDVKKPEKESRASDVRNSVEDDFWSNDAGKPEQIHYDLEINGDNKGSPKDRASSNSDDDDKSTRTTGEKQGESSVHTSDGKEESDRNNGADENRSDEKETGTKDDQNEKDAETSKDSPNDYMAGFAAGVKASQHDEHEQENHDELNESVDDEDLIITKGPSLHTAIADGDVERVRELITHDASLRQQTDEKGWVPLHVGCARGQLDCVKLMAVSGDHLEEETPTGYTSMHLAAMNGHVNCMMVLFALGAEINCRTVDECTPLHLAAMSGHVECVKWLLANRAKHDVTDANGRTPAQIAEEYCYEDVEKLLKSFKNEVNQTDSTLAHLMTYEGSRKISNADSSKVTDSGMGGLESGEESWVSDNDEDDGHFEKSSRPSSGKRVSSASSDGSVRGRNKTDTIATVEEKQKLYERQRQQMKKRHSSFLDSIRMDVEDDIHPGDT